MCIGRSTHQGLTQDEGERLQRLLGSAERLGQTGSWEFRPASDQLLWSHNLYRIFGLEPGEITPTIEYALARTHPDDKELLSSAIARVMAGEEELPPVDYRITLPNQDLRHLRATFAVAERRDGRPHCVIGVLQDLTDSRRAEREIAALVAVAEALAAWEDLDAGASRLMARLGFALDCVSGVFWVPRAELLIPRVVWHESGVDPREPAKATRPLRRTSGLAANAWAARKPLSWTLTGREEDPGPPALVPDNAELGGAVAIPALAGQEVLAIIELTTDHEIRISERLQRTLCGMAHELGQFLAQRRGELAVPVLTPREVEMLQFAAYGLSVRETAERLNLSPSTVKTHLENIYRKLKVSVKPSAVATALRLGVID